MALKSSDEVIVKQAENLKLLIKEAKHVEANRLHRLDLEKDKSLRRELEKRFEAERSIDKQKIERLRTDFEKLKTVIDNGSVDFSKRVHSSPRKLDMDSNRFSGLESETDILFHRSVCKKVELLNSRAQTSTNKTNFKPVEEYKKLNLLNEKRDVLKQMIQLHEQEIGVYNNSTGRSQLSSGRSDISSRSSSSSTGNSWATFANSVNHYERGNNTLRPRPRVIPSLNI